LHGDRDRACEQTAGLAGNPSHLVGTDPRRELARGQVDGTGPRTAQRGSDGADGTGAVKRPARAGVDRDDQRALDAHGSVERSAVQPPGPAVDDPRQGHPVVAHHPPRLDRTQPAQHGAEQLTQDVSLPTGPLHRPGRRDLIDLDADDRRREGARGRTGACHDRITLQTGSGRGNRGLRLRGWLTADLDAGQADAREHPVPVGKAFGGCDSKSYENDRSHCPGGQQDIGGRAGATAEPGPWEPNRRPRTPGRWPQEWHAGSAERRHGGSVTAANQSPRGTPTTRTFPALTRSRPPLMRR